MCLGHHRPGALVWTGAPAAVRDRGTACVGPGALMLLKLAAVQSSVSTLRPGAKTLAATGPPS